MAVVSAVYAEAEALATAVAVKVRVVVVASQPHRQRNGGKSY